MRTPCAVPPPSKIRRVFVAALCGALITTVFVWVWAKSGEEQTWPDKYDFGIVAQGTTIEFGSRFLMVDLPLTQRLLRHAPRALQPGIASWLSKSRRVAVTNATPVEPTVELPPFIGVSKIVPVHTGRLNRGRPYYGVDFSANTESTGVFSGVIKIRANKRYSTLPVRYEVAPRKSPRILVASSPFDDFATEDGNDFAPLLKITQATGAAVDWRARFPQGKLDAYRIVVLAEEALVDLDPAAAARVRAFVATGGRLVIACNYYYRGSVGKANEVLEPFGLQVIDQDIGGAHSITNIFADPLTTGVRTLRFHRPSPIRIIDASAARILAPDNTGAGGYVAVSRLANGGEVIVIAQSLWWNWVADNASDGNVLLQNALSAR